MSKNRSTDWNFPSWEQEQEMKRSAEIHARALKEELDKANYEAKCAADKAAREQSRSEGRRLSYIDAYVQNAVESAPNYAAKREQTLSKAQTMDAKGGTVNGVMAALLRAFCK